ncbi:MAG: hypothetical protein ACOYME_03755 [Prochlorotrichaceae cyanobacterium]|jgi:polyhydroxyalkanoate synthesis regulator phasin
MDSLTQFFRKAVYLGVGLASYAGEKASDRLSALAQEAQKKADELVKRGELTTEEARRFVEDILEKAQAQVNPTEPPPPNPPQVPKTIDIVIEEDDRGG